MSDKSKVETIKESSRALRGTIADELQQDSSRFAKENVQLLKFHGIYQQEDRDLRKARREAGQDKAWQFMVRIKNPGGGRLTAEQWTILDAIADRYGNGTLRVTTRQGIQFHGVGKNNLRGTIQDLDSQLISTFGACGDGVRNIMACPVCRIREGASFDGQEWAVRLAQHLAFGTTAYYEIWLDGERVPEQSSEDEPLYGKAYLPRKFKIAFADVSDNCVDVLTNDIGILPAFEGTALKGFHVFVGGGLGSTHKKEETYPRLADALTFVDPDGLVDVVTAIVATQRDLGNRSDRRQARMKYLVDKLGIDGFRAEVENRLGHSLPPLREFSIRPVDLHFGWHRQNRPGLNYLGIFVENGRVEDRPGFPLRSTLRRVIQEENPTVYLTPNQDIILADIPDSRVAAVTAAFEAAGMSLQRYSRLRTESMACPALPTCGLAITEAERRLPGLIDELEAEGFGEEAVKIRMSGCPNSCSRPPVAEIGLVGKAVDGYSIYLGGNAQGTRLAELYLEPVTSADLASELGRLLRHYREHRESGEGFGDFCFRVGVENLRRSLTAVEVG